MMLDDILSQQRSPLDNTSIGYGNIQEGKGESSKTLEKKLK